MKRKFETGHGEECSVNGVNYEIKKLLGKGKGGYLLSRTLNESPISL